MHIFRFVFVCCCFSLPPPPPPIGRVETVVPILPYYHFRFFSRGRVESLRKFSIGHSFQMVYFLNRYILTLLRYILIRRLRAEKAENGMVFIFVVEFCTVLWHNIPSFLLTLSSLLPSAGTTTTLECFCMSGPVENRSRIR